MLYKILNTIIILILTTNHINAQNNINKTDENGLKQGFWKKLYLNNVVAYEGQFKDNIEYGTFIYYFDDASKKAKQIYRGFSQISFATFYHINGEIQAEGVFNKARKDSIWKYYNNKGILISIENYILGNKHNEETTYFENGNIAEVINYKNNQKNGAFFSYNYNGTLKTKGFYLDDLESGLWIYYDTNGKEINRIEYKKGLSK